MPTGGRLVAVLTLARTDPGHAEVLPVLQKLLQRHPSFFCFAADTLIALGPKAAAIAPLIQPLTCHPSFSIPEAADRVLRRLDPQLAARAWSSMDVPDIVPHDLGPLWEEMASKDGFKADMAAWRLVAAGPKTVELLRNRLRPPNVLTPARVERLIADLDSEEFEVRQRASSEMAGVIEFATPQLRKALDGKPTLEVHHRIDELLKLADRKASPEERRRLCALRVLESMASAEARDLLRSLAHGDPRLTLTREAAAAIGRLEPP